MTRPPVMRTLLGLVLTLGVGSLPFPIWDHEFADVAHLVGNEAIYWVLVAVVLVYVRRVEGRPFRSIGFAPLKGPDMLLALVAAVAVLAGLWVIYSFVLPALALAETEATDRLLAAPGWWLFLSVIRAGVSEEILFRGYPIERLQELTGNTWIAGGLPLCAFTLAHVGPWGWSHVLVAGFGGWVFTALYFRRRNLWVNILAHCLVDGAAVLA